VIDIGLEANDEEAYEGPVLVIFAVDPGVATGWSALKVPVRLLASHGATRTLVRCRHRHGTIRRSGGVQVSGGGGSYSNTDSAHVTEIFRTADAIFEEWCTYEKVTKKGKRKLIADPDTKFVFALEGFDLRESSMDPALLSPVRVNSIFMDRLAVGGAQVRVFFQSASDAKRTVTDERLRRWGLYDSSSGAHARDADRHATLLLRRFASDRDLRIRVFGYDPIV
jgi:hypothetical protein